MSARGRFLSKKIGLSIQLGRVSLLADHLFTKCIPHLDRDGRIAGDPAYLKATAVPLRAEITIGAIQGLLDELEASKGPEGEGLIVRYASHGQPAIYFPGFARSQQGLRPEREEESQFTDPPNIPPSRGKLAAKKKPISRHHGDKLRQNGAQVKGSEVKRSEAPAADVRNWPASVAAILTERCGPCAPGEAGKALAEYAERYSPEEMVRATDYYARHSTDKPEWKNARTLAKQFPQWVKKSAPVQVYDDRGELTPEAIAAFGKVP